MAKKTVNYVCTECGWSGGKWYGRCPECGQWGTIEEFHEAPAATGARTPAKPVAVPTATPSKATVKAKALPGDATALLRAMPDHVSNFARVQADSTDAWADSNPIEEYKLTYSNGNDKDAVQLTVAQWSDSEKAQGQYTKLTGDLKGSSLANGVVKVNGDVTGNYEVKTAESDDTQATAVWRNDTVVFSVTGTKNSVVSVYQLFPL